MLEIDILFDGTQLCRSDNFKNNVPQMNPDPWDELPLPSQHPPFISLRPWKPWNTREPASSSCTSVIHEADKIERLWKWGHIWFWQTSRCHSSSCICHFICITPRGLFIHICPNHTQFHITIGFFLFPAMTDPILWIHADNLHYPQCHFL